MSLYIYFFFLVKCPLQSKEIYHSVQLSVHKLLMTFEIPQDMLPGYQLLVQRSCVFYIGLLSNLLSPLCWPHMQSKELNSLFQYLFCELSSSIDFMIGFTGTPVTIKENFTHNTCIHQQCRFLYLDVCNLEKNPNPEVTFICLREDICCCLIPCLSYSDCSKKAQVFCRFYNLSAGLVQLSGIC